jgi:hypothetical protein
MSQVMNSRGGDHRDLNRSRGRYYFACLQAISCIPSLLMLSPSVRSGQACRSMSSCRFWGVSFDKLLTGTQSNALDERYV